jgi:hypothetical protein
MLVTFLAVRVPNPSVVAELRGSIDGCERLRSRIGLFLC